MTFKYSRKQIKKEANCCYYNPDCPICPPKLVLPKTPKIDKFMCQTDGCQEQFRTYEEFQDHLLLAHLTKPVLPKTEDKMMNGWTLENVDNGYCITHELNHGFAHDDCQPVSTPTPKIKPLEHHDKIQELVKAYNLVIKQIK